MPLLWWEVLNSLGKWLWKSYLPNLEIYLPGTGHFVEPWFTTKSCSNYHCFHLELSSKFAYLRNKTTYNQNKALTYLRSTEWRDFEKHCHLLSVSIQLFPVEKFEKWNTLTKKTSYWMVVLNNIIAQYYKCLYLINNLLLLVSLDS